MIPSARCLYLCALLMMCTVNACSAKRYSRQAADPVTLINRLTPQPKTGVYSWKTAYYEVPVDNFAYTSNLTYPMKYLYNLTYYEKGGPIFFYTGNEGSIEGFAENTGIMWDLAKQFKAAIVFAEHRYYGTSMPFGNLSYTNVKYLGYLASTQALADYAKLIPYLKEKIIRCPPDTPVISFGGSYGGMLSAWFRMKYPDIVTGAWASSAPLMYFPGGGVDPGAFDHKVKEDFLNAGCNERTITNGLAAIMSLSKTAGGRRYLNDLFHIEQKSLLAEPEDGGYLIGWINEAIVYMAMVDYPYPSNFLEPLPGWPINYVCKKFAAKEVTDEKKAARVMYEISNVYYNFTGAMKTSCVNYDKCGDTAMANLGSALGWPWQTCTELVMAMCSEGPPNDFFSDDCKAEDGPVNGQYAFCNDEFGLMGWYDGFLHPDSVKIEYGFNFAAASNIVFTNGDVDPWSPGGVYKTAPGIAEAAENGVYTFLIAGSAHHLDLRQPNSCDPPPVRNARYQIVKIMECWVNPESCPTMPVATELPPLGPEHSENCHSIINGFPWGQDGSGGSSTPEQLPTTTPEQPPTTTPEQPSTTIPEQPPTTTPEQPPTTTPEQPSTTTPEQLPTTTPEQPPITTPEQPPTTTPEQPTTKAAPSTHLLNTFTILALSAMLFVFRTL